MSIPRIVVIGGGFAGVQCAKRLRQQVTAAEAEIMLFDQNNHLVFSPLLAEVAGASISPDAVAAPLRQLLPTVQCRTEAVRAIHLKEQHIAYETFDSGERTLTYDHLVIACGNVVNLGIIPGMIDHGFPLKTVGDGMIIRAHVLQQLEAAEVAPTSEKRRWHLSFLVVGGGFSGVEVAGEINDLVRGSSRRYSNLEPEDIHVTLIHSRDQILPEVPPSLREFAREQMTKRGIHFELNSRAALVTGRGVRLKDGRWVEGATVVCAIGTSASPLVEALDVPKSSDHQIVTDPDLRVKGIANVWAVGDCAENPNVFEPHLSPGTGQFAEREGRQAADNIVRVLRGEATRPFAFKPLGVLCSIGGHRAVAEIKGVRLSGFWAWFVWRGVYLFKMPTWSRRIKIGFDWAWDLFFARDLVYIRSDVTKRVASAHFAAGDYIFHAKDPAADFYVIESGEVEILHPQNGASQESPTALLGPGDFFGEMALLEERAHSASARARTPVRAMVLSKDLFGRISGSWGSLKDVIMDTVRRRKMSVWTGLPQAQAILERESLSRFVEPLIVDPVLPQTPLGDIVKLFAAKRPLAVMIADHERILRGVISLTDIFRAVRSGAHGRTPAENVMTPEPVFVTQQDSLPTAIETMRNRKIRLLPVVDSAAHRRVIGHLRAEKMVEAVLTRSPATIEANR